MFLNRITTFLKTRAWSLIQISFLLILVHLDGNAAMLVGMISFMIIPYYLLKEMYLGVVWLFKRQQQYLDGMKSGALRFCAMVLLVGGSVHGCQFVHTQVKDNFAPMIRKIEKYRFEHGHYPAEPIMVDGKWPSCGVLWGIPPAPYYFMSNQEDDWFAITCMTFGFNHFTYDSRHQGWFSWD